VKSSGRLARINDEILRETSDIIRSDLKDPRVETIVSVLRVETSSDLRHCKLYVSILGDSEKQEEAFKALENASGFIRKRLAERANLRLTPEIRFIFDDSLEHGFRMHKLIDEANRSIRQREKAASAEASE
jgi:ribosome-binding factor A